MIGLHLLLLAGAVSLIAPRVLPRAGWVYRSPRLGLAAWYAVITTIGLAVLTAGLSLVMGWPGVRATVCTWWAWCLQAIRGAHGHIGRIVVGAAVMLLALLVVRAARMAWRLGRAVAARRRAHEEMLTLLGAASPQLGATVVDLPVPVAYVVPGRPARVVISTAALDALAPAQLSAVLAHERAHAHGRHHLLADVARLLHAAFPNTSVFGHAHRQIDRLVEMRADEVATCAGHARLDLARALVTMADAGDRGRAMMPANAVAATGGDALERLHRLLQPPLPLPRSARAATAVVLLALVAAPALLVALSAVFPVLAGCPSLT